MSSIPPFADLAFSFQGFEIARFPCMIFTTFIESKGRDPNKDQKLLYLTSWADTIGKHSFMAEGPLIEYLQTELSWNEIQPYIALSKDSESAFKRMWDEKKVNYGDYNFSLKSLKCPRFLRAQPGSTLRIVVSETIWNYGESMVTF